MPGCANPPRNRLADRSGPNYNNHICHGSDSFMQNS
jgi:hypothetical protein